jgi:hypothetical protein
MTDITEDGKQHSLRKIKTGIILFNDIKQNGLMYPVKFIKDEDGLHLFRGSRRLAVLKALGIEEVPCKIIIN